MTGMQLLGFVLTAGALLAVPGPHRAVCCQPRLGVRRAAVASVTKNFAGAVVEAGAVAAGLGAIVATSRVGFSIMELAGGVYVVYLGIKAWRERRSLAEAVEASVVNALLTGGDVTRRTSDFGSTSEVDARVALSLIGEDEDHLRTVFDRLADGGSVKDPLALQFWGDIFGTVVDRFGISWQVNVGTARGS
jgi:uncharacterized glyoxalase superfamily protein PhnB